MSSAAQIHANVENAKSSTGPVTEAGKAASSRNRVTHGLFGLNDFVRPHEADDYTRLESRLVVELQPETEMENTLTKEIVRATWRLYRCGQVESTMLVMLANYSDYIDDPMQNEKTAGLQNSVDRARAQTLRILHKCTAEIRKLQAERRLEDERHIQNEANPQNETNPAAEPPKEAESAANPPSKVPETIRTQSQPSGTARNAQCPCNSGQKYKRCCGKCAPPVLRRAA